MEQKIATHEELLTNQIKINKILLQAISSINDQLCTIHKSEHDTMNILCDTFTERLCVVNEDLAYLKSEQCRQSCEIGEINDKINEWLYYCGLEE